MEAAEAQAALARRDAVQDVGKRAHAQWYARYLAGFLGYTLLLLGAAAAARSQPAVAISLNAAGAVLGIAAMAYAGTRPVVTRDFRGFHAAFSLGWTVLYAAAVVVGSVWNGGAPAAWWGASFVVLGAWAGGAALLVARKVRGR